jgi:hypothetical protein
VTAAAAAVIAASGAVALPGAIGFARDADHEQVFLQMSMCNQSDQPQNSVFLPEPADSIRLPK